MAYDAVSAYTVLFGDGDSPAQVSVHGTAEEAWHALDDLLRGPHRPRRTKWLASRMADPTAVREAAERWRCADPTRRYWQVAPHRLQVTVPAIARA